MAVKGISRADIEKYLNLDPEFIKEWVSKNIQRNVLEQWLQEKFVSEITVETKTTLELATHTQTMTRDAAPEAKATNFFDQFVKGTAKRSAPLRKTRNELLKMNQQDMFMELIRDIANELDVNVLCHKILINVGILTRCDRGSLFLARGTRDSKYLVSKLFDVTENSSIEETLHTEENHITVPFGRGIAGTVALTKLAINIKDAYQDARFNKDIDKKTGYRTRNILCMPILDYEGECIGVAQIINKMDGGTEFTLEDEEVFKNYLTFCGIGLTNAQMFEMSVGEFKQNQLLLTLAKGIFAEQTSLEKLVQRIMLDAQDLIKCLRCSVYLVTTTGQDVQITKAFEMNADNPDNIIIPSVPILQRARSAMFARVVAMSAQILNIADAVSDPKFGKEIEDYDGFRIKSLLSVPITNGKRKVIGVVQMMNKANGKPFTESDISTVETFAIFCGLGVHNCQLYENVMKLMARQKVALEVLAFHAMASPEDVQKLSKSTLANADDYKLYDFDFDDTAFDDFETCKIVLRMFMELNVINKFKVHYDVLCRFTLTVKKNYRPVSYHNWRHAVNVTQTMFAVLCTGNLSRLMEDLEMYALIVACLCHDIDHRGTNNAALTKADSPLATLYGSSLMEHHHYDQCVMILSGEGNNIFANLSVEEYKKMMTIIESAIIATDMAVFIKKKKVFSDTLAQGEKHWADPFKKELLRAMMMTACDVASVCKPWEMQFKITHLVMSEFFDQGDGKHEHKKEHRMSLADRRISQAVNERRKLEEFPKLQVGFIDTICAPVFQLLMKVEPGISPLYTSLTANRTQWQIQADLQDQKDGLTNEPVTTAAKETKAVSEGKIKDANKKEMSKTVEESDLMDVDERPVSPEVETEAKYTIAGNFFPEHTRVRGGGSAATSAAAAAAAAPKAVVRSKVCTVS